MLVKGLSNPLNVLCNFNAALVILFHVRIPPFNIRKDNV
jgi:hypothetical protein